MQLVVGGIVLRTAEGLHCTFSMHLAPNELPCVRDHIAIRILALTIPFAILPLPDIPLKIRAGPSSCTMLNTRFPRSVIQRAISEGRPTVPMKLAGSFLALVRFYRSRAGWLDSREGVIIVGVV